MSITKQLLAALAVVMVVGWFVPQALLAQDGEVLWACYVKGSGVVYRVNAPNDPDPDPKLKDECSSKNHVLFSWNAQGPPGPPGPPGDASARVSFDATFNASKVVRSGDAIPFDVERHDDGGHYNAPSYQFMAPADGVYHFSASVHYNTSAAHILQLVIGGLSSDFVSLDATSAAVESPTLGGSATVRLAAGTVVWVRTDGPTGPIRISNGLTLKTHFSGHLVYADP